MIRTPFLVERTNGTVFYEEIIDVITSVTITAVVITVTLLIYVRFTIAIYLTVAVPPLFWHFGESHDSSISGKRIH